MQKHRPSEQAFPPLISPPFFFNFSHFRLLPPPPLQTPATQAKLHLEKTAFAQEISRYLLNAAIHFDEVNARSHLQTEHVSAYAKSIAASKSDISRASRYSSSSVVLEKRAQAVKANAALRLAEQEQLRKLEGEIKLVEIEKKHKELLRQQRMEMEESKLAKQLEMLRQQSERKLAEARQRAAIMDMEEQGEIVI